MLTKVVQSETSRNGEQRKEYFWIMWIVTIEHRKTQSSEKEHVEKTKSDSWRIEEQKKIKRI